MKTATRGRAISGALEMIRDRGEKNAKDLAEVTAPSWSVRRRDGAGGEP